MQRKRENFFRKISSKSFQMMERHPSRCVLKELSQARQQWKVWLHCSAHCSEITWLGYNSGYMEQYKGPLLGNELVLWRRAAVESQGAG